ncbi:MAG: glycosyltransferase family 2 protein [Oscillospiraceae bacterium]
MNDAFCARREGRKGAMRVKNPEDSPFAPATGCISCFDFFFSRARMNCGLSSKLVGTGFAVHRSVLEKSNGWNSVTIAEDAEFAAYLAETGTRVWFVPEAVTYDEAPTSVLVSLRQRRRWSSGVMDVAQAQLGSLACGVFDEGGLRALDMLAMLTQPFCQAASFFLGCALVLVQPNAAQTIALLPLGLAGGFRDDDVCVFAHQNSRRAIQLARDFAVPAVYGLVASVKPRVASVPHKGLARDRARETGDSGGEAAAVSEGGILSAGGRHAGTDVRLA